jgi:DNA-directed RNA polymerase alpha subunit
LFGERPPGPEGVVEATPPTPAPPPPLADAPPDRSIDELELPARVVDALIAAGITTVGALCAHSEGDLRDRGVGPKALRDIGYALDDLGLRLRQTS